MTAKQYKTKRIVKGVMYRVFVDGAPMFRSSNALDAKEQANKMATLYTSMNPDSRVTIERIAKGGDDDDS